MKLSNSSFSIFYQIIFITIISVILLILLFGINKIEEDLEEKMFEVSTEDVIGISENTISSIQRHLRKDINYASYIRSNKEVQSNIEEKIEVLITDNIKYAYLLYKDKKGTFRFLADGSKKNEKAFLNQKLDITDSKWFEIYEKKEPIFIWHKLLQKLSITYISPIMHNNEVEVLLAIDFSIDKVKDIENIISMMKKTLVLMILISIIFLSTLIYQVIKFKKVEKTAFIDKLTNINNRNFLQENKNSFELTKYILVALDIDHFKKINDQFGHDTGDKVLKEFAKTIQDGIRKEIDVFCRYGGEEFLLLLKKDSDSEEKAIKVLKRVFESIQKQKIEIDEKTKISVTVSIGVNINPNKSKNFDEAFKLADKALYEAKETGRNNIKFFKH